MNPQLYVELNRHLEQMEQRSREVLEARVRRFTAQERAAYEAELRQRVAVGLRPRPERRRGHIGYVWPKRRGAR